jgi:hypothetical protein
MKVTVLLVVRTVMGVLDPSMNVFPLGMRPGRRAEPLWPPPLVGYQSRYSQAAVLSDGTSWLADPRPASAKTEAGFRLSTIEVGIRIVVPLSFVVS